MNHSLSMCIGYIHAGKTRVLQNNKAFCLQSDFLQGVCKPTSSVNLTHETTGEPPPPINHLQPSHIKSTKITAQNLKVLVGQV